ncbi:NAD(P)H-dependent flavin oxidoreductase [Paracoccus mangrovi]|uniref:Propionate 3-nitronate monooxygenase n=1 Tax=Paracoccus mangrovi TaxID=1715645 RepID=A0ABV7R3N8_9RHOB
MMQARNLNEMLAIRLPILQAPMAGTSTPAMAAAVSEAGGLGALGLGAATVEAAAQAIRDTQERTSRAFNVNFFCHAPRPPDPAGDRVWIDRAAPLFQGFGARPPAELHDIYDSFRSHDRLLGMVLELRPRVVSFHFGLPQPHQIAAMRAAGLILMASATSLDEARQIRDAGLDAVIAQGWEAGGHRGIFDPAAPDARLSAEDLTRTLVREIPLPVIAAGGIMDGGDIGRALSWGAQAAQLGTAFVGCPESAADAAYRARLSQGGETVMTPVISGRPARCLSNSFTDWGAGVTADAVAAYPRAYDLGKALNAAAKAAGQTGYGAQWSGMGASRARAMPVSRLMAALADELAAFRSAP